MDSLSLYIADLKEIEKDFGNIVRDIIKKNQGKILTMIKLRLYNTGIDGAGNQIGQYYYQTIKEKKAKGQRSSFVTLRDSGDWYRAMYVEMIGNDVIVDSTDWKTSKLIEMYSADILGLTIQEEDIIINAIIEPEVQKLLDSRNQLNIFDT